MLSVQNEAYITTYFQKHFLVPCCGTEATPTPHFVGQEVVRLSLGAQCACACVEYITLDDHLGIWYSSTYGIECDGFYNQIRLQNYQSCVITHLKKLELDAPVSGYLYKGQLVEARQQQLHIWQERFEAAIAVIAQGRVQTRIETRLLQLPNFNHTVVKAQIR